MASVLITGANRGIGLELARQYAASGAKVIATARNPEAATDLAAIAGVQVEALEIGDPASIAALVDKIGDQPLDIVVNNAGATGGGHQSLDDLSIEDWHDALNVNTIGPLLLARATKGNLAASGNGKLMTLTSQLAASTWPMGGMYIYSSTKAAVSKVHQALAIDWREEPITVALMHPGWVKTDMGGPHAEITAQESAAGIIDVITNLGQADSGKFYKWNGDIHPW